LKDAGYSVGQIDEVILVGGSTRIPAVRNLLTNLLNKPLNETVNPDEVVALGAAVQAGIIAGEITDLILLDVTPLSLGVETMGGLMTTIINRNASIPVKQSEVFSTAADQQDTVEIHVLQGERPFAKDNKSLGIFKLKGIPAAPRGVPKINVTFQLDVNGLLSVSAREEQSGQEQSIKIEGASVLAREEVSKMIKEAEENSDIDKSKKALVNITYELDNLIWKNEVLLEKNFVSNSLALEYCEEILKEVKTLYKTNEFKKIYTESLDNLKYAYNILISEYFKQELNKNSSQSKNQTTDKGSVIDVTEE
jgi:molecular chaperone DnaK